MDILKFLKKFLKKTEIDNIWMILSPQSPEKSSILDKNIRLRLMEIALRGLKNIAISKIEFNMPQPNYTHKTLKKILKEFPKEKFKIIMGQDNYENLSPFLWLIPNPYTSSSQDILFQNESTFISYRNSTKLLPKYLEERIFRICVYCFL